MSNPVEILVGRELSAVCFVRDYVEFHFDGPILRALSNPYGHYAEWWWRFPEGQSTAVMRHYIGKVVSGVEETETYIGVDFSAEHIRIPLDDDARRGPEAANLVGVDEDGRTDAMHFAV